MHLLESKESKELGLASKKIGIAREVLALTAESFNVAAHDIELVNALLSIRNEDAVGTPDKKKKSKVPQIPGKWLGRMF